MPDKGDTVIGKDAIAVTVKPGLNVRVCGQAGTWSVIGLPARLQLVFQDNKIPSGWIVLQGRLHRRCTDYTARLFAEVGKDKPKIYSFDIPVTRKGTILELLQLPHNVNRLLLQPMDSVGEFELEHLSVQPVGVVERIYRMIRRVLPAFVKYSRQKRMSTGLHGSLLVFNLRKAYQIVGRLRAYAPSIPYDLWIEQFSTVTDNDRKLMLRDLKRIRKRKHFIVVITYSDESYADLDRTIGSVTSQLYSSYELVIAKTAAGDIDSLAARYGADAEVVDAGRLYDKLVDRTATCTVEHKACWLLFVSPGTIIAEQALYWFVSSLVPSAGVQVIYSDHDRLDQQGVRTDPVFKPDWSPQHLRSTNYIGPAVAYRAERLLQRMQPDTKGIDWLNRYAMLLRMTEQLPEKAVRHIPALLFHVPAAPSRTFQRSHDGTAVADHLRRLGIAAGVEQTEAGHNRIRYCLPTRLPKVSIIIPTRDTLQLLKPCVDSILSKTTYKQYEIIIVDNQSSHPKTHAYFARIAKRRQVCVIEYSQAFNYAAIVNFAAQYASGKILCLLNNDTEVISADWLDEMVGHLAQRNVGVVGAKLLYSDGRVQHGGDTVGPGGCAHHLHSFLERNEPGYCDRAVIAQELSAVTAACMLTWSNLYRKLGGFDAENLPVAFNDVDYCLRAREAGYKVIWTPHAQLYHHESVSRGRDDTPEKKERSRREARYMRERWGHLMHHDPFYNPNLSYERPDFSLSSAPTVMKPWSA